MSYKVIVEEAHAGPFMRRNAVIAADELAAIRGLVKALSIREVELKAQLFNVPAERFGADFIATVDERAGGTRWKDVANAVVTESLFDINRFDELCEQHTYRPAVTVTLRPVGGGAQ